MSRIAAVFAQAVSSLALLACSSSSSSGGPGGTLTEGTSCTQAQHDTGTVCSGTQTFNCKATGDAGGAFHWDLVADCSDKGMVCSGGACVAPGSGAGGLTEGTACTQAEHDTSPVCSGTQTFNCKASGDAGTFHWDMVSDCIDTGMVCSQGHCIAQ